jgi:Protein of unknown function (DUF4089)
MRRKAKRKTPSKKKTAPKKRAIRAKQPGKRMVKASGARGTPAGNQHRDFIDGLMLASAQALGLTIDPAWRDSVKSNLRLVLDHAARVEAFPLPDDAEPAPLFHA